MHAPPAPTRAWRPALRNSFTRGTHVTYPAVQLQETTAETPGAGLSTRPAPAASRFLIPLLGGIFAVLMIAGLRLAASLLVPIAIAIMMTLLLGPLVRGMRKYRVAEPVGAGVIVFGTGILFLVGAVVLAAPAAEWLRRAPIALRDVESKLRSFEPVTAIQETASSLSHAGRGTTKDSATARVEIVTTSPLKQIGWKTADVIGEILTVTFLTYFLLAGGSMFRRKLAYLFPSGTRRTRIKRALLEIEDQMSRYLLINTVIGIGFGVATWGLLAAIGIPNPILWG